MKQQLNFIVSVIPKSDTVIGQIEEEHALKNELAKYLGDQNYRCLVGGEDMMSEIAKNKVRDVNVAEAIKVLESAKGSDFYTIEFQDALSLAIDALRARKTLH